MVKKNIIGKIQFNNRENKKFSGSEIPKKQKEIPNKKTKLPRKKDIPTLQFRKDAEIATDFAMKAYKKFGKVVKSIILFGSAAKQTAVENSDIDIIIILDDVSVQWDQELIAWYREELDRILRANPYKKTLHINTIKLSTWWQDLMKGDPVIVNVLRYGEALVDMAGFFNPIKFLLIKGKIKSTPEAIYNCLERAPMHMARSKASELNSIEGLFWAMVDSAHAALISARVSPASPENIPVELKDNFVINGRLKMRYVVWYRDLLVLHKRIVHGEIKDLKGIEIDMWQAKTEEFLREMTRIVREFIG